MLSPQSRIRKAVSIFSANDFTILILTTDCTDCFILATKSQRHKEKLTKDGNLPEGDLFTEIGPYYRLTEAGWDTLRLTHFWVVTTCIIALATLIGTICGLLIMLSKTWWDGKRVILSANVIEARSIGRYDSKHLDTSAHEWENTARKYWSGILTVNPTPEVLVNGIVQLYGWEPYACLLSSK